jgi:hypothetical protein
MGDLSTIEGDSKKSHKSHEKKKHKSSKHLNEAKEIVEIEESSQENRKKSAKKVSFNQLTEDPQFEITIEPYNDNKDKKFTVEEVKIDENKKSNISTTKKGSKKHNKKFQENSPYLSHLKKPAKTKGVKFLRLQKASSSSRRVYESSSFDIYAFDITSTDV